jgi:ABC-type nitrate/sulfonate/bicarbonate transport system substrate-binding protein
VLFTTEDLIAKQPELVAGFIQATVAGMQAAIDNVDAATKLTISKGEKLDLASETESMRLALPLMNPAGSRPGMMTNENWADAANILRDQQLISDSLNVIEAYNLNFLIWMCLRQLCLSATA